MDFINFIPVPVIYVIIFIVFLLIVHFIFKFNMGLIDRYTAKAQKDTNLRELAQKLGLQFQDLSEDRKASSNKNLIYDNGWRIFGSYKDVPMELIMASKARHHETLNLPYAYSYHYSMERKITFTVHNPDKKTFHIQPKNNNVVVDKTGNNDFNEKLTYSGDKIVPKKYLKYFAEIGWINLTLKGDQLIFHDNFYDQFQTMTGGKKMLKNVHPVWKTSASQTKIDLGHVQEFIDTLVDLIKDAGLK